MPPVNGRQLQQQLRAFLVFIQLHIMMYLLFLRRPQQPPPAPPPPPPPAKQTPRRRFYLFGVLRRFQHCTSHITTGSWKGRGNQYMQFARVLYCKLPTNGKQLPAFPPKAMTGMEPRPQRWEARVLPLCHRGPS